MKNNKGKSTVLLRVVVAVVLFSLFRQITSVLGIVDSFVNRGWTLSFIILVIVMIQMIAAGIVVLIVLPIVLGFKAWRDWLSGYLRVDLKIVLLGLLSFAGFCALAAAISLSMGIFKWDLSTVLANPDIRPDPDVVGWGYFLLALIPAIWEELAFRGWIQSKISKVFSMPMTVLLSSIFFALFHFSNLLTQTPSQVISGVIMAFFFGIGWGYMTVKTRSVIPVMLSHYLVDSMGMIFLGVDSSDPVITTGFFLLLTLMFPVFNIIVVKLMVKQSGLQTSTPPLLNRLTVVK